MNLKYGCPKLRIEAYAAYAASVEARIAARRATVDSNSKAVWDAYNDTCLATTAAWGNYLDVCNSSK